MQFDDAVKPLLTLLKACVVVLQQLLARVDVAAVAAFASRVADALRAALDAVSAALGGRVYQRAAKLA